MFRTFDRHLKLLCALGFSLLVSAQPPVFAIEENPTIVRVYTHGEGKFARTQPDGNLLGSGVDLLRCSMGSLSQPYSVDVVSMTRSWRLDEEGGLDIWFPTYDVGDGRFEGRLVGPIGFMGIYWFTLNDGRWDVTSGQFREAARVTAFPGSRPERMLRQEGYQLIPGTDDENRLLLMLLGGQADAILAADFLDILQPRARQMADRVSKQLHQRLPMAFELTSKFHKQFPAFRNRFQAALNSCVKD